MPKRTPVQYAGTALIALVVAGGVGYMVYDEVTRPPSSCDRLRERIDAWETVLGVPGDLSKMGPTQALEVLDRIERSNPQGYAEWQEDIDWLWGCD